jgi:hypothetical protein
VILIGDRSQWTQDPKAGAILSPNGLAVKNWLTCTTGALENREKPVSAASWCVRATGLWQIGLQWGWKAQYLVTDAQKTVVERMRITAYMRSVHIRAEEGGERSHSWEWKLVSRWLTLCYNFLNLELVRSSGEHVALESYQLLQCYCFKHFWNISFETLSLYIYIYIFFHYWGLNSGPTL